MVVTGIIKAADILGSRWNNSTKTGRRTRPRKKLNRYMEKKRKNSGIMARPRNGDRKVTNLWNM
jgi:hypothetical protein